MVPLACGPRLQGTRGRRVLAALSILRTLIPAARTPACPRPRPVPDGTSPARSLQSDEMTQLWQRLASLGAAMSHLGLEVTGEEMKEACPLGAGLNLTGPPARTP